MMAALRLLLGLGCLALGCMASGSLYAAGEGGACSGDLMLLVVIAATISSGWFGLCRVLLRSGVQSFVLGAFGSYVLMVLALLVLSWARGELAQTQMWLPIIILFGVPFMAPVVLMSGLAT